METGGYLGLAGQPVLAELVVNYWFGEELCLQNVRKQENEENIGHRSLVTSTQTHTGGGNTSKLHSQKFWLHDLWWGPVRTLQTPPGCPVGVVTHTPSQVIQ